MGIEELIVYWLIIARSILLGSQLPKNRFPDFFVKRRI